MKPEDRQKDWVEQFGDHSECPVCGTDCEMLYVDEPKDNATLAGLRALVGELADMVRGLATAEVFWTREEAELLARAEEASKP